MLLTDWIKKIAKEKEAACFESQNFEVQKTEKKKLQEILHLKRNMVLSILDQDLAIISLVDKLNQKNQRIAS